MMLHINLKDGGSQSKFLILMTDKSGLKLSSVVWQSKHIKCIVKIFLAAETSFLVEVAEACFWLQNILNTGYL